MVYMTDECKQFLADNPSLERIDDELCRLNGLETQMVEQGSTEVGVLQLRVGSFTKQVVSFITSWKAEYSKGLIHEVKMGLTDLIDWTRSLTLKLSGSFEHLEEVNTTSPLARPWPCLSSFTISLFL